MPSLHNYSSLSPQIVVVKVGTSSLLSKDATIRLGAMAHLVESVHQLRQAGHSVVVVSSGAVGEGLPWHQLSTLPEPRVHLCVARRRLGLHAAGAQVAPRRDCEKAGTGRCGPGATDAAF